MKTLQRWLVESVTAAPVPDEQQRATAIGAIRDLGGVAVLGSTAPSTERVRRYVEVTGGQGDAVLLGSGGTTDPVSAALVNGSAAQAFDFDDIAPSCVSHVSALMVPTIIALVDRFDAERALDGYVRGLMVIDRLAEAFTHEVYDRGIQPTHTMGSIGALAALLWAADADEATRDAAFGLLATQMVGLRSHTGTRYKAVQAGSVASAAVRSFLLAEQGLHAGHDAIDVMVRLMGVTQDQLDTLVRDGELRPVALAPKWYPTCGAAHTAIEAAVDLRELLGARTDAPARIRVTSPPRAMNALAWDRPTTPDEARFSMHYCVATAWSTGHLGPADFSPDAIRRDDVRSWLDRVDVVLDDALTPPATWSGFPAVVEAIAGDGTVLGTTTVDRPRGYPERPLSSDQLRQKFLDNVTPVLRTDSASAAYAALDGADVLRRLGQVLAPRRR
jgi:2-methylcitrate dehydratase PrpD